jgi:chain length determinant protein tyrosine kinase EpsG
MNMNAPTTGIKSPAGGDRSIGAILVDSGKLSLENAELVINMQRQYNIRFGEAALKLGLVTEDDIQYALASQYGYAYLRKGDGKAAAELIAAYEPYSERVEALRALRSQLMLRWFTGDGTGKALAIVSPGRGEGRSFLAANLAIVFSQLGVNTLLVDADMRNGRMHRLFNLENQTGLSGLLAGRTSMPSVQRGQIFANLSVMNAGPLPPNPQELLGREIFQAFLAKAASTFDVILIDTPAGDNYADAQTIGARASGALMVVRENHTPIAQAAHFGETVSQLGTTLVGAVLNRF